MLSNRILQIIKILQNQDEAISAKRIGFELGLSSRTIRNEIKNQNKNLNKVGLEINSFHRKGYQLNIVNEDLYYDYLSKTIEEKNLVGNPIPKDSEGRVHYIIKKLLVSKDYIKSEDICDEIYISRSTFNNDFIKVKESLEYFNLHIESKPGYGMILRGSEIRKRSAISMYFYDMDSYSSIVVEQEENTKYNEISNMLLELMHKHEFRLTDLGFKNLVTHIIIALIRLEDNFAVPTPDGFEKIVQTEAYDLSCELCDRLEKKYEVKLPESERLYIALHLSGKESSQHINANQISFEKNRMLFDEMYQYINDNFGMDLSEDIDLFTSLSLHFEPMRHRLEYGLRIENPLLETIKQEQSEAFEVAIAASKIIEKHWGFSLSEEEIAYIALHFALSIDHYHNRSNLKNVLIVCASGVGSSQILLHKVKQQFASSLGQVEVSELYSLDKVEIDTFDFVLTTVPIKKDLGIPILEVNYFLSSTDVRGISNLLSNENSNFDFIDKYFSNELFFADLQANTAEEAITLMCEEISKVKTVPNDFLSSVLEREAYSATEFGNQIALPHPMRAITDETFVAIGVLEKPILWKNNYVRFVMLISVSKDSNESLNLFNEVISTLALDADGMLKFSQNPNLETLKAILYSIAKKESESDLDMMFK